MVDAVAVPSKCVDHLFGDIFDHREAASHVSVKRCVSSGHLRFVAGGEDYPSEFVGYSHHYIATDTRLHVFLSCVGSGILERFGKHAFKRVMRWFDRYAPERDAQAIGELLGIYKAAFG